MIRRPPRSTLFPYTSSAAALSPAVRRIVEEEHLDPAKISGTGAGGRLTKADVLTAAQNKTGRDAAASERQTTSETLDQPPADGRFVPKKRSPLRGKTAHKRV